MVGSAVTSELMKEYKEQEDEREGMGEERGEGSSSTENLALRQVPVLQWDMLAMPEFWAPGPSV